MEDVARCCILNFLFLGFVGLLVFSSTSTILLKSTGMDGGLINRFLWVAALSSAFLVHILEDYLWGNF